MEHGFINEIAICIVVAWLLALVAELFKQPLILAYLVAGFAVGPVGLRWIEDHHSIERISAMGLVFLLFMIGLEIDLKKMANAGRVITLTAAAQIFGGVALGVLIFWLLGFPLHGGKLDALYLGVGSALSSTVIIVKVLYDKRELDTLAGRITLGILVLQDVAAILFLAFQPNLNNARLSLLLLSAAKALLLVVLAFSCSRFVLPYVFKAVARLPELVLVGALAWCFSVAELAARLGLSREMGALIAGVAISTFPYTLDVVAKVTALRDFFVTLFFVALGMNIPAPTSYYIGWATVVVIVVLASRLLTVFPILHRLRQGHRVSLLPTLYLSQISEFSLVILAIGALPKYQHVTVDTRGVLAYAFVILAVLSTYGIMRSDWLLRYLSPWLIKLGWLDLYQTPESRASSHGQAKIFLLGFFWTASSLLEELRRHYPDVLNELAVVDYNPLVNEELRRRGINIIYGDITERDTLLHAGIVQAEILICTIPNSLLKGSTSIRLVQQLREINPKAQIIVHADGFGEAQELYAAGASYVSLPRLAEAAELCAVIQAARNNILDQKRSSVDQRLADRREVLP